MAPDPDHYMTQAIVCFCTAAILMDFKGTADAFFGAGVGLALLFFILLGVRKYRGDHDE